MHVKHVSNVTFYHLSNRQKMPNVMKISVKINTMQNFNILLLVLNKLKALQLSKVGLSTIKHQHSKKLTRWIAATWTKKHMNMLIVCKSLFTKGLQNVNHLHVHMPREWRRFLPWSTAVSIMTCRKSDHTAIKHSFSTLRTVNVQKAKCWYFARC